MILCLVLVSLNQNLNIYCFSARINFSNINITLLDVDKNRSIKIDKNTANAYACYEKYRK